MAKLDSFGRPYYETAEEYNQAHRRAKASGAYGQMEQEKKTYYHTAKHGTKKTYTQMGQKKQQSAVAVMGIGVGIVIIAMMSIMMINLTGGIQEDVSQEQIYVDDGDGYYEEIGVDDMPLAEGFNTCTYEDVAYTIPMSYEDFILLDVPLEMYPSTSKEVYAGDYQDLDMIDDAGNYIGFVRVENESEYDLPMGKCMVTYISFVNDAAYGYSAAPLLDVTFANGLNINSTYEELETNMGLPTYKYTDVDEEGNLYEYIEWQYNADNRYESFSVTFWNGVILDVSIVVDKY